MNVPEGRFVIEGRVIATGEYPDVFGQSWKMTVEHEDGWRVWGTIPAQINPYVGDRVRFEATVTQSIEDPTLGIFKRPREATMLEST